MGKFYGVKKGRNPGVYEDWKQCQQQIIGFKGSEFKGFETFQEAYDYVFGNEDDMVKEIEYYDGLLGTLDSYAFVDGSFNESTKTYGCGGFLIYKKEIVIDNGIIIESHKDIIKGSGNDSEMAQMRNVAGEILGARTAIERAISYGLKELHIIYDYSGIKMWATGEWKRNKKGTEEYYQYCQSVKDKIKLTFIKVKGHTGIPGNEEADKLAKESCGIQ